MIETSNKTYADENGTVLDTLCLEHEELLAYSIVLANLGAGIGYLLHHSSAFPLCLMTLYVWPERLLETVEDWGVGMVGSALCGREVLWKQRI